VPLTYLSPDGKLTARIVPTGREAGAKQITNDSASGHGLEYECRVEIYTRQGHKLWEEDFSSPDADHGRGVAFARWSPDSNFFVFSTVSSGGHHPWQYYTYAFSRQKRHLYLLDPLLGEVVEQEFTLAAPDHLTLKVLDRKAMERNPNADFPDKKVTVELSQLLDSKRPLSKALLVNPPMRGYYQ
jgi:hypothetical protein